MFSRIVFALLSIPMLLSAADPAKSIVRYVPMKESPRSIYVPLRSDLHLAYDTELLRIHTVWSGEGLQVNGTPHTGSKTPYISTVQGARFHTYPPVHGWMMDYELPFLLEKPFEGTRFKGTRVIDGVTTFSFDLGNGLDKPVLIEQSVYPIPGEPIGFGQVLRVPPRKKPIYHAFDIRAGHPPSHISSDRKIVMLPSLNGFSAFAVDSIVPVEIIGESVEGAFTVRRNVPNGGDIDLETEEITGRYLHLSLMIPAHDEELIVYLLNIRQPSVVADANDLEAIRAKMERFKKSLQAMPNAGVTVETHTAKGMQIRPLRGDDYYSIESFPLPKEVELKVTGMDWLPNGDLAVCTWPGEIWIIENHSGDVADVTYRLFAEGLNEPLGLAVVDGEIIVAQKPELTRLLDTNGDGVANTFETISSDWGYTGNYHAFAFGPAVDPAGNFYVAFCGQRARQDVKYASWMIRISPDGKTTEGFASGLRAPNGFGFYGPDNDLFVADNQGNWVGASKLNHVKQRSFYGFPAATPAPSEMWTEPPHDFSPPAIWFPRTFSPSTSGFATIPSDRFGPFGGQMIIADFQNSVVLRVQLEKVNGEWQGAVFPFMKGFESGANRVAFDPKGRLYVGGVKNKAWSALGPFEQSLERISWKGETPFSVKAVHAKPDGFELVFTKPQLEEFANDPESYFVSQFNYQHHQTYGSPEFDHDGKPGSATEIRITKAQLSRDGLNVRLTMAGLRTGYVTRFLMPDLESTDGDLLRHDEFFYTLNEIPKL